METNLNSIHEDAGLIPGLVSGSGIWSCRELWCSSHICCSDLALLWLWCRPAAVAPIRSLAWELPYAAGAALKSKKKRKETLRFPAIRLVCSILHLATQSVAPVAATSPGSFLEMLDLILLPNLLNQENNISSDSHAHYSLNSIEFQRWF